MSKDLYDILGVGREANEREIKRAYRRLAMKYHPDRNKEAGAEARFKEIQGAYAILSDAEKRQQYDKFGTTDFSGGGSPFQGFEFGDIFNEFFGGSGSPFQGGNAHQARQGRNIEAPVPLTLEEAVAGCQKKLSIAAMDTCDDCHGTGRTARSQEVSCRNCDGQGVVRKQVAFISMQETCRFCNGAGTMIKDPCPSCKGQKVVRKRTVHNIEIPAGVGEGDIIRNAGRGEASPHGGPPGDLLIVINIKPHDIFVRNRGDLHCRITVPFTTAALGGTIKVPTIEGMVEAKLPAGFQPGKKLVLRGKGITEYRARVKGDLICEVIVETPRSLNSEQKELLRKLDASISANSKKNTPGAADWLAKVKKFFAA